MNCGPQKILAGPKKGAKADKWEINHGHKAEQATNPIHKAAYYVANKIAKTQIIDARSPERHSGELPERG